MMKRFDEVFNGMIMVNDIDEEKVNDLVESMKDGWKGMPILYHEEQGQLITGSHRMAALNKIDEMVCEDFDKWNPVFEKVLNTPCFLEVSEEIEAYCEANECTIDDIDFSSLSEVFEGTNIEKYAAEMEW